MNNDIIKIEHGKIPHKVIYVREFNKWLMANVIPRMLKKIGIDVQFWYDENFLNGIRPKCPYCGKDCKWISFSRGYIATCGDHDCRCKHSSESSKLSYKTHPTRLENRRKEMTERFQNKEYKLKHIEKRRKAWENPTEKMLNPKKKKGKKGERGAYSSYMFSDYENKDIHFDSNWERIYFINTSKDPDVIFIKRSPYSIPYLNPEDNEYHRYFPDFLVEYKDGHKEVIEIKPSHLIDEPCNLAKSNAGKEFVKSLENTIYKVISDRDYKFREECQDMLMNDKDRMIFFCS